MDLPAYRIALAQGLPDVSLEAHIARLREVFEVNKKHMAAANRVHIPMFLALGFKAHVIFFEWLLKCDYMAFVPAHKGKMIPLESADGKARQIFFAPKGITMEEVEASVIYA